MVYFVRHRKQARLSRASNTDRSGAPSAHVDVENVKTDNDDGGGDDANWSGSHELEEPGDFAASAPPHDVRTYVQLPAPMTVTSSMRGTDYDYVQTGAGGGSGDNRNYNGVHLPVSANYDRVSLVAEKPAPLLPPPPPPAPLQTTSRISNSEYAFIPIDDLQRRAELAARATPVAFTKPGLRAQPIYDKIAPKNSDDDDDDDNDAMTLCLSGDEATSSDKASVSSPRVASGDDNGIHDKLRQRKTRHRNAGGGGAKKSASSNYDQCNSPLNV